MYTCKELEAKIKAIDDQLAKGIQTVAVDGTSTTVNLAVLQQERDRLEMLCSRRRRRPTTGAIYLG